MSIVIRRWTEEDAAELVPIVYEFLRETMEASHGDWAPSRGNVEKFVTAGIIRAKEGDPVVGAWSEDRCVGFLACLRAPDTLERQHPILLIEGFYVIPELRGQANLTVAMDKMVCVLAREKGYTEIQAICRNPVSYGVGKKTGWNASGVWMTRKL